ncbi:hypothetical protein K504DRAFT_468540 [Pleomassaria siparia CBS 279.74]|uniref:Uncharacterized protein n=1 Tax=Pleomassaria siparia CBS 279.74 TaxID=1314801 RepID=A0A6G1K728_9PLEO|nr:hypothetical protein K504DRAFT_468540 [Pleomassaria siparia CBS 279.74]
MFNFRLPTSDFRLPNQINTQAYQLYPSTISHIRGFLSTFALLVMWLVSLPFQSSRDRDKKGQLPHSL